MPKDYHSIMICDYDAEVRAKYVYENGEVYKRLNGTKGMKMKKTWAPHTQEHFWNLNGRRYYEGSAKLCLQDTPNPQ
jgi:hypothetical protein